MHVKPGQQAGDGKDPVHQAVRPGQRETAALRSNVLAVPDKHGKAGTVDADQAPGEVGDVRGCVYLAGLALGAVAVCPGPRWGTRPGRPALATS